MPFLAAQQNWSRVTQLLDAGKYKNIDAFAGSRYDIDAVWEWHTYTAAEGSALMWAAEYGKIDIMEALLQKGANINLRDSAGRTAMSRAYDRGQIEAYDFLKNHGAIEFQPLQNQPTEGQNSSSSQSAQQPSSQNYFVTVYFNSSGTRMSSSMAVTATSKGEAEREAERQWKTINGWNSNLQFIEAVANW
ncbi:MAG: ankyrin repeat domain-containing protein [Spirochaetaceae bacterium]|nr:ankyrin repeat domain-containing protein [Spirochaetaceae bacterium]